MAWATIVSAEHAATRLIDPRLRVFDCRYDLANPAAGREAWLRGHLPGAIHVDIGHDLAAPETPSSGRHPLPAPDGFAARLRAWGVNDDSLVLVYDDASGLWAARLWWMTAKWLGHRHVAVLDGGFSRWTALGLPVTTASPAARAAGNFAGRHDPAATVDADATQSAASSPDWRVLDARAPERYRGEVEPIDKVAGHIPGALNHPTSRVVGAEGTLRPATELAAAFARDLGSVPPERTVAYCGSGVTACHLLLALERAGLPGAKLYPGSWSEWSRDPSRPVARGSE
ncbi:MAG TPA: sulfurtransferase [Steroidobacteraceae bacterium]|nr:sulfurtransferase [Steroidobacteraceae bacterium]